MIKRNREKEQSRICLCCIVKDDSEAHLFERMFSSFMPHVHGLAVVITGISGQHERLRQAIDAYGGASLVTTPETHPQLYASDEQGPFFAHFGEARNLSCHLAEKVGTFDWLCWADADDILLAGHELQLRADHAFAEDREAVLFHYWYSITSQGQVETEIMRERLLRAGRFRWFNRIHEVAGPLQQEGSHPKSWHSDQWLSCDYNPQDGRNCVWVHQPDPCREDTNGRNIRVLEFQRKEEEDAGILNPRTPYFLGNALADMGVQHSERACTMLREFLASWDGQPCPDDPSATRGWQANFIIGGLLALRGDSRAALAAYQESERCWPGNPLTMRYMALLVGQITPLHFCREQQ